MNLDELTQTQPDYSFAAQYLLTRVKSSGRKTVTDSIWLYASNNTPGIIVFSDPWLRLLLILAIQFDRYMLNLINIYSHFLVILLFCS